MSHSSSHGSTPSAIFSALGSLEPLALDVLAQRAGAGNVLESGNPRERTFVQLGGDSLSAMHLAALTWERFGLELSVELLLGDVPLQKVLASARPSAGWRGMEALELARATSRTPAPAPYGQDAMWISEQAFGGPPHNLVFVAFLEGTLEVDALMEALWGTVARHEALRTCFRFTPEGLSRAVLEDHHPTLELVCDDASSLDAQAFATRAHAHGRRVGSIPFQPESTPYVRFLLVRGGPARHAFVLVAHHLLLDGWSIGLILRELFSRYDELCQGQKPVEEPAPTLEALLAWQRRLRETGRYNEQARFWRQALEGIPSLVEIPGAKPRGAVQDPAGAREPFGLGEPLSARLRTRASELGATPFALLLTAFGVMLRRFTGRQRLAVGIPAAGRPVPELQRLVGLCSNIVPVVLHIQDDATVAEQVASVQRSVAASLAHSDLPFAEVLSTLGAGGEARFIPYVQLVFAMHDRLIDHEFTLGGLRGRVEDGFAGRSPFDLTLFLQRSEPQLAGAVEYATALFGVEEVRNLLDSYRTVLEELLADTSRHVSEVRGISAAQRALLERLNATDHGYRRLSIDAAFLEQAGASPGALAVEDRDLRRTYQQLARDSALQAERLVRAGVRPGEHVMVRVERSYAEVVALLGVLRAGATYVAVESDAPPARVARMLEAVRPRAVLSADAAGLKIGRMSVVEPWHPEWDDLPEPAALLGPVDPDRVAYVAFTSGSTGTPKGVCVTHRGVLRLVDAPGYVALGAGQRMMRFAPLAFDASTLEVWGPLLSGGTLVVHPPGLPSPVELSRFLAARRITVAWLTSGLFRLVADFAPTAFAGMRWLLTGGDVVPAEQAAQLLATNPGLTIINGYGPTENTTFTTVHVLHAASDVVDPLPIGQPIPGTRLYILDENDRLLPPGAIGELHAAGDGLALGYLGDTEMTARRFGVFSPDVPERLYRTGDLARVGTDGRVHFHGRRDEQVKVRGHRIELEEVRQVLQGQPGVRDAVVFVSGSGSLDKHLIAAVVPDLAPGSGLLAALREAMKAELPMYMHPARWVEVERIPVTANGKVDRRALEELAARPAARDAEVTSSDAGTSPREAPLVVHPSEAGKHGDLLRATLRAALAEALDIEQVKDTDDFFDLGGDSLRAARLLALIRERMGVEVPLREFYPEPTLERLVSLVSARRVSAATGAAAFHEVPGRGSDTR